MTDSINIANASDAALDALFEAGGGLAGYRAAVKAELVNNIGARRGAGAFLTLTAGETSQMFETGMAITQVAAIAHDDFAQRGHRRAGCGSIFGRR